MVAGGITPTTVGTIAAFDPAIVVVGAAITSASDPVAASADMHEALMSAAARRAAIAKFGATGWRRWTPRVRKVESASGWRRSTPRVREGATSEPANDRRVA
jgi:hypothetical protein